MSSPDNPAPAFDGLVQFAGLARDTKSIELVVLVSPITFRHPAVYVKTAVTLADMSGGRFKLGLGTGWMDSEHEAVRNPLPDRAERFEHARGSPRLLPSRFRSIPPGYDGERYKLSPFEMQPAVSVPLVIGGFGPHKTPRLAGKYCDEFNVYAGPIDEMRVRIERAREAAVAADRDPDDLFISHRLPAAGGCNRRRLPSQP